MVDNLVYTTDPMDVCINNYEDCKFAFNDWIISDHYVPNKSTPRYSKYSIVVTSPKISNEDELFDLNYDGQKIIDKINSLIPFCTLQSLDWPMYIDRMNNTLVTPSDKLPKGWRSNYNDIKERIDADKKVKVTIEFAGICHFSVIERSPLKELEIMISKYDEINEEIKFLIFMYNSILISSDNNVFLLIGKVLDFIKDMYPYNGSNKIDKRISENFPELVEVFGEYTLHNLLGLANERKETRHYNNKKKGKHNLISHESLSSEEKVIMFKCSTSLLHIIIRDKFGLPRNKIEFIS